MKIQVVQDLLTFSNTSFLKEQRISNVESGLTLFPLKEEPTTQTPLKIAHITTRYFPPIVLELGLWMESERMLHPVINQIGVDTQNEVVKEEKRQRIDNAPYGKICKSYWLYLTI